VDCGRVGGEGGVGVGDESLLQGWADDHVAGAGYVGAGYGAQPSWVTVVAPAPMPAGASGFSSAMAASPKAANVCAGHACVAV
jgi:hypothetical protein